MTPTADCSSSFKTTPRPTLAERGRRVGLSAPAAERLARLEEDGVITGYTAKIIRGPSATSSAP